MDEWMNEWNDECQWMDGLSYCTINVLIIVIVQYTHLGISAEPTTMQQITQLPHHQKDMK